LGETFADSRGVWQSGRLVGDEYAEAKVDRRTKEKTDLHGGQQTGDNNTLARLVLGRGAQNLWEGKANDRSRRRGDSRRPTSTLYAQKRRHCHSETNDADTGRNAVPQKRESPSTSGARAGQNRFRMNVQAKIKIRLTG